MEYGSDRDGGARLINPEPDMDSPSFNSHRPRVSIGLPVYNGAALLAEALDALLAQTLGDFELVISDNASTDATEEICRTYAQRDRRIRYVRQEVNRGAMWNFNQVFHLSRGEYFKWAAHDDVCKPAFLERCVEVLDHNPEIAWCHTQSRHIDGSGNVLARSQERAISYVLPSAGETAPTRAARRPSERFQAVILGREGCLDSFGVIRREVLLATPLYLPFFGSEKALMAEIALRGRYAEVPEVLFFARIHEQAAGHQQTAASQQQFVNPLAGRRWQLARPRMVAAFIRAVRRAPLGRGEQLRCYGVIVQYLFQVQKWKGLLASTLAGKGVTAEYPATPRQAPEREGDLARGTLRRA